MIQLLHRELDKKTAGELKKLQAKIDAMPDFAKRADKAQSLWTSKGGKAGIEAFVKIGKELYKMCVFFGVCNYCEQSEANDIEHIFPKSFFPGFTFQWTNYLLACKQCNTGLKLDLCDVLDDGGNVIRLKRGEEPPFSTISFINPRTEDPNTFMVLNPLSHKFELRPEISDTDEKKAKSTIDILELNTRDTLLQARRSAARYYYDTLCRLANILKAASREELEAAVSPYDDRFNWELPIESIKIELLASYRQHITTFQHPSVWYAVKLIQSKTDNKWKSLFAQLPAEVLDW